MIPKGMHKIRTAQSLINRSVPASQAQIAAQLARMEHERVRLERELKVWLGKHHQTEARLERVRQDITLLKVALDTESDKGHAAYDREEPKGFLEIPLEY